jgi:hypothetical protein
LIDNADIEDQDQNHRGHNREAQAPIREIRTSPEVPKDASMRLTSLTAQYLALHGELTGYITSFGLVATFMIAGVSAVLIASSALPSAAKVAFPTVLLIFGYWSVLHLRSYYRVGRHLRTLEADINSLLEDPLLRWENSVSIRSQRISGSGVALVCALSAVWMIGILLLALKQGWEAVPQIAIWGSLGSEADAVGHAVATAYALVLGAAGIWCLVMLALTMVPEVRTRVKRPLETG